MIGGDGIRRTKHLIIELTVLTLAVLLAFGIIWVGTQYYYRDAYPMKYAALIDDACERRGLDRALVYAVVRTESSFRPDAVSSVGARGLMQLMPDTFDWVQSRRGLTTVSDKDILFDPETNIETGTALLRLLLDEFQTDENTLSAYHAGRDSANNWLKNPEYAPNGRQIENIPFANTRAYVERVCKTKIIYQKLYDL